MADTGPLHFITVLKLDVKAHDKILNHSFSENVFEKVNKFDIKKMRFFQGGGGTIMPPLGLKGLKRLFLRLP